MTLPVKPGDKLNLTINLNEKNYKLFGKIEDVDAVKLHKFGSIPAFKIQPYAELDGKRVKKGIAWMYFSADKNRYPLLHEVTFFKGANFPKKLGENEDY